MKTEHKIIKDRKPLAAFSVFMTIFSSMAFVIPRVVLSVWPGVIMLVFLPISILLLLLSLGVLLFSDRRAFAVYLAVIAVYILLLIFIRTYGYVNEIYP